ncbi:hypothetical protein PanWU01x14_265650 [Parasponia andersonii]|uniref:DUF4408 domain-containing protein n=1 Tax=Parasponia andersonii TaxID=3476 RepID=A0A2P5B6Z8_PARAD|nr:hypothetical protein PanWU01x14_265650 [Parasponia andersonii]
MAMYSSGSSNSWALSLKVVLISTGVLSMAVALKLSVPVVTDFVASEVPSLWSFVLSWLKPPYLYVVINCIIISIVASSKLHQKVDEPPPPLISPAMMVPPVTAEAVKISGGEVARTDYAMYSGVVLTGYGYDPNDVAAAAAKVSEAHAPPPRVAEKEELFVMNGGEVEDDEAVAASLAWNGLQRKDSLEICFSNENEKPPVSARFGHRKSVKASPEGGKSLRVSKPKRQDTLESTWKTITEGRSMPLTRHLKKSDTWESHVRRNARTAAAAEMFSSPPPAAEKFHNSSSATELSPASRSGAGKLRKEPSLSQDELNRRVEAFIKKFNEEMRLQRQESLNQYQEMIRRGAH